MAQTKKYSVLFLMLLFVFVLGLSFGPVHAQAQTDEQTPCQELDYVDDPGQCPSYCKAFDAGQGSYRCMPGPHPVDIPYFPDTAEDFQEIGNSILNAFAFLFAGLAALILGIAGVALNLAVKFTILEMSNLVSSVGAIDIAWTLIRDVANIAFIFIVLIIAISLILRVGKFNSRSLLIRVIVAALLINFSLFFTRVIIDASNIVAIELYQPLAAIDEEVYANVNSDPDQNGSTQAIPSFGISGAFVNEIGVLGINNFKKFDEFSNVIRQIMGGIFMLVAAFVFLLAAILLVIRFVMFILLMITSPIAWLGMFLPAMKQWADKWWKAMLNQAFFAPLLMLMFTLSYLVISDNTFEETITGGKTGLSLGGAFQGALDSIPIVLNFIIGIGFLIASIIIAKSMAATSSGSAVKWATQKAGRATFGAAGFAGRQTFGRAGRSFSDPKTRLGGRISTLANSNSAIGRGIGRTFSRGADKLQKGNFDAAGVVGATGIDTGKAQKGGFEKIRKDKAKREGDYIKQGGEALGAREVRKEVGEKKKEVKQAKKVVRLTTKLEKNLQAQQAGASAGFAREVDGSADKYLAAQRQRRAAQGKLTAAQADLGGIDVKPHERELGRLARTLSTTQIQEVDRFLALQKQEKSGKLEGKEDLKEEFRKLTQKIEGNSDQNNFKEATTKLGKAEKAVGAIAKAGKEKEATKHIASMSGPRRESAKKARKELSKGKDKELLGKIKSWVSENSDDAKPKGGGDDGANKEGGDKNE